MAQDARNPAFLSADAKSPAQKGDRVQVTAGGLASLRGVVIRSEPESCLMAAPNLMAGVVVRVAAKQLQRAATVTASELPLRQG